MLSRNPASRRHAVSAGGSISTTTRKRRFRWTGNSWCTATTIRSPRIRRHASPAASSRSRPISLRNTLAKRTWALRTASGFRGTVPPPNSARSVWSPCSRPRPEPSSWDNQPSICWRPCLAMESGANETRSKSDVRPNRRPKCGPRRTTREQRARIQNRRHRSRPRRRCALRPSNFRNPCRAA